MVRKDIKLDKNFHLKDDFSSVSGRDEFHQAVAIRLKERIKEIERSAGLTNDTESKLKLAASRIARKHDYIDDIYRIVIDLNREMPGTVVFSIDYEFDETYTEMIK
jgi:hypothetical protein